MTVCRRIPLTICSPTLILHAHPQERKYKKRTVIVASFGIYDASSQLEISKREGPDFFNAAALAACRGATAQFTRHAAAGDSHTSPLVFLLQSNAVKSGGVEQIFLDEVHRVQREEIGFGTRNETGIREMGRAIQESGRNDDGDENTTNDRSGAGDNQLGNSESSCDSSDRHGVFLVEDTRTMLQCIGQSTSSQFREHAKVVEAKMFWNLIVLVDREHSLSPATLQATRNEHLEAPEPPGVAREMDDDISGPSPPLEAGAVWSRLQEAALLRDRCFSPPCSQVRTRV